MKSRGKLFQIIAMLFVTGCGSVFAQSNQATNVDRGDFGDFIRSLNVKPYGYTIVEDPTGKAPASKVERFEVRSGDCHFNGGWSDCEKDRERSELWEQGQRDPVGTTAWYGWSFYVSNDWPDIYPTKTVLGQFHQHRAHPVWMFLQNRGRLVLDDQSLGFSKRKIPLISASDFKGKWHRIEVQAKWEKNSTGFFKVWVDGKLKFDHQGQTMTKDTVYFRYGIYRSFVSRYKVRNGKDQVPTQSALFANVKKATNRAGLQ